MRKLAAILLIIILFFNWYGYRIITGFMERKADQQLETRLDNNQYDESQLIEIRVAINMPYQVSQSDFERHYGEIKIDGKYYTYVKRKIDNGYLVLKCIPNSDKQQIKALSNDFFKMANDLDPNAASKKQDGNSSMAKNFWSEYDGLHNNFTLAGLIAAATPASRDYSTALYHVSSSTPEHPPKQNA